MQSIHKVVKVVNNQVIIDLPPGFEDSEVEVILKSTIDKDKNRIILDIEREIDAGIKSNISPRCHGEIFNNLKEKYVFF